MVANTEFTEKPICTASRQYQKLKMEDLQTQNLSDEDYQNELQKMSEKSCLCKGLAVASLLCNHIDTGSNGDGVAICPGPNMAYFSQISSLNTMVDHIYGRTNIIQRTDRPNMFVKELMLYIDYLKEQEASLTENSPRKQLNNLKKFKENLLEGIEYYLELYNEKQNSEVVKSFLQLKEQLIKE